MMSTLDKANCLNSVASLVSTTLSIKVFPALSYLTPFSSVSPLSFFHNLLFIYLSIHVGISLGLHLASLAFQFCALPQQPFQCSLHLMLPGL